MYFDFSPIHYSKIEDSIQSPLVWCPTKHIWSFVKILVCFFFVLFIPMMKFRELKIIQEKFHWGFYRILLDVIISARISTVHLFKLSGYFHTFRNPLLPNSWNSKLLGLRGDAMASLILTPYQL